MSPNKRTSLYVYRSVRLPCGNRKRLYFGRGKAAELELKRAARARAEREADQARRRQLERDHRPLDKQIDRLWESLDELTAAFLIARGFYRHDRGAWRKRNVRRP